ncbi:hypothetical protein BN938_2773 [Mucinivorans hirudinis]|uniref:Uncharacterized protein n=1 Tax=Mucinivorans hirudinis TaxID=1433126 RepID=A0A060RB59_9BACT|nr:hypothetical protein BN938_2773 [Mucinivorans hirudinis]
MLIKAEKVDSVGVGANIQQSLPVWWDWRTPHQTGNCQHNQVLHYFP